jgi:hypothetical protein
VGVGNDGLIDGILAVSTISGSVLQANFGLDQLPNSLDASASYLNPGGTSTVTVPFTMFTGSDPEDGQYLPLTNKTIRITSMATNGTLYYNGIPVIMNQVIPSYNPALLSVDPNDGGVVVMFNYAFIDAAGEQDPTPALVTLYFYVCPEIVNQPLGGYICQGSTYTMSLSMNEGNTPVTYQWQISAINCQTGFIDIQGATNTNYTTLPLNATRYYRCLISSSNQLCSPFQSSCVTVTVNPAGQVNQPANQALCNGSATSVIFGTSNTGGTTTYAWTNSTTAIGLGASGSGNISFTAANTGTTPLVAIIVVTPTYTNGGINCTGPAKTFTITVNPTPHLVTHPQSSCSPNKIDLTAPDVTSGSTPGLVFTYWTNAAATISYPTPTMAMTGTYYIKGTVPGTGCYAIAAVSATINPLPTSFTTTGSGSYCAGGPGIEVIMSGSQLGVVYTMWNGCCNPLQINVAGTGGPISFGYQKLPGFYSILAENTATGCINWMYNCTYVSVDQPVPVSVSITPSANPVPSGSPVTYTAAPVNGGPAPFYQWKVNGANVGMNLPSYTYIPDNQDVVSCVLTSSLSCVTGNPAASNIIVNGVPGNSNVTGVVLAREVKCYSASQTLTIAGGGTTFVVENGGSATMIAGQKILYLPGTTVQAGGYMHGYISINNQYCMLQAPALPTVATMATGEEEPSMTSQESSFIIYPNPTNGNFTLEQKHGKIYDKVQVEIYGMRGERLLSGEMTGELKHEFWSSDLPHGLYFVKVVAGGYVETFKLVKTE